MTFSQKFYTERKDNPSHIKAKARISALLQREGWSVREEWEHPLNLGELGMRNYCLDISAWKGKDKVNVEVDGESHLSLGRLNKDALRDAHVKMSGYRVARFDKDEINGKKLANGKRFRLTDAEILDAIKKAK